jgi:N-acetylglucosamine kinase-like BadF-type ATPase
MNYYLGVDGGGSSTRALVADARGRVVGRGNSSDSNFLYAGIAGTSVALAKAVEAALAEGRIRIPEISAAYFGMAGVVSEADRQAVGKAITTLKLSDGVPVGIDHDIRIALTGGLAGAPGIALIVGTGSACYGLDAECS